MKKATVIFISGIRWNAIKEQACFIAVKISVRNQTGEAYAGSLGIAISGLPCRVMSVHSCGRNSGQ